MKLTAHQKLIGLAQLGVSSIAIGEELQIEGDNPGEKAIEEAYLQY